MGVTIGFNGVQPDPVLREQALEWACAFAADMEWAFEKVSIERARGFLGHRVLEAPRISGLSLLPHFACEPVPLQFLESTGDLVDSVLVDEGEGDIRLQDEALTKTQFAGPAIHAEVCQFLAELRERFVPNLTVDDETRFFETGDTARLQHAFDEAWASIVDGVAPLREEPGGMYEVGGVLLRVPSEDRAPDGDGSLQQDHKELLSALETWLMTRYGGFGLDFDRSPRTIENLDLLMVEADKEQWFQAEDEEEEAEQLVHAMGAAFGRTIESTLGGRWELDEEEGLTLTEIGGVGIIVNPFEVAAQRFTFGPAFAFQHHYDLFRDLTVRLSATGEG